ncbi:MAG: EAL domain-containing protein [Anaerorhabdus sp.]|uniref:EAL domain-containing protein n=1 Tax=Anaerorhabdus sp. TaxID=1872524 RepID=UPI002FC821B5
MKNKKFIFIGLTVTLFVFLMVAFVSYNHNFTVYIQQHIINHLEELLAPNEVSFELQVNEQVKKVKTIATIFAKNETLGTEDQIDLLDAVVDNNNLENCMLVMPDGTAINQEGITYRNMGDEEFFKASMNGEFYISEPVPSLDDPSRKVMIFSAPIVVENQVTGVVLYSYWCDTLNSMFNLKFLDGEGRIVIIDENGYLLIGDYPGLSNSDNVLDYFKINCKHADHPANECSTISGERGVFNVETYNGKSSFIVDYVRIHSGNWYMLSIAPESAVMDSFSGVFKEQNKMIIVIIGCLMVYGLVLLMLALEDRKNVDKMTGSLTRNTFIRKARRILKNNGASSYAFVKLDVKNFKIINRVHDFDTGNRVIINMAKALDYVTKTPDSIYCRLSVDNFVVMIPFENKEKLAIVRSKFITKFRDLMGKEFTTIIEFPTGEYIVTPYDKGRHNVFEIMEKINFAHSKAKLKSGGAVTDYYEDLEKEAIIQSEIENKMNAAFHNKEFKMYLQPKVCLKSHQVCGAEALVRWKEKDRIISPADFIPLFEKNGFIAKIDFYIFEQVAIFLKGMIDNGLKPFRISINFSRVHLYNESFVMQLKGIADKYKVPYEYFEIELTETIVFENINKIINLIGELHAIGFTMSMDDFGSGYSSLSLLKDIDVDVLKIDKAFFVDTVNGERAKIVISNIIDMAKELKVKVVAEGIETEDQVEMLKELNCDVVQGYYYFKPMAASEFDYTILDKEY